MKIWSILAGTVLTVALSGCADKGTDVPTATLSPQAAGDQSTIRQPNVSGSIYIHQKVALPPNAVLTVTLSDASLANAPSKVISQRVVKTNGKQAPFKFTLPFNPADIQPNARILLSAAITIDGRMTLITDTVKQVINNGGGYNQDLVLVPVLSVAVPAQVLPSSGVSSASSI